MDIFNSLIISILDANWHQRAIFIGLFLLTTIPALAFLRLLYFLIIHCLDKFFKLDLSKNISLSKNEKVIPIKSNKSQQVEIDKGVEQNKTEEVMPFFSIETQEQLAQTVQLRHNIDYRKRDIEITEAPLDYSGDPSGLFADKTQEVLDERAKEKFKLSSYDEELQTNIIKIYFATDRAKESDEPSKMFGGKRADNISYGHCFVSMPKNHSIGELESPYFKFLKERPEKHVVLCDTKIIEKSNYFNELKERCKDSDAFIFIHGYNVTFKDAARRTAQIAADIEFNGAPILYSWPSQAKVKSYPADEQNIEWSEINIFEFLIDFLTNTKAKNVFLIAHSMGNRGMTRALIRLYNQMPELRHQIKEVILAAPDIDADVFKNDIAPNLITKNKPITLYACSTDKALGLSHKFHGYPRAGDSGNGLILMDGIETIDATKVDTSFLGHSFYAQSRPLLSDISYLIKEGKRPNERFSLKSMLTSPGKYWEFKA